MRNYPEWVIAYWATVSIGAAVVGMNAWWTSTEMEFGLADSRPKVLIADDERLERRCRFSTRVRATAPLHVIAVRSDACAAGGFGAMGRRGRARRRLPTALPDVEIDPDDDACIFYTSGTTGFPKGAQLTHRGLDPQHPQHRLHDDRDTMAEAKAVGGRRLIAERRCAAAAPASPC